MNTPFNNDSIFGTPVVNAFGQKIGKADHGLLRDDLLFRDNFGIKVGSGHIGLDGSTIFSGSRPIGTLGIDGSIRLK